MLIPFGLKDGKIYHVENVPNGLACDCVCPNCRKPLIAKNKGEWKRPHFAHAVDTDCFNYEAMGYLHKYAQQLLEAEQSIVLPEFLFIPEITLINYSVLRGQSIKYPAAKVVFDSIQSEYSWYKYRIDSHGTLKNRSLFIEITVTHANELEKIAAIREQDQPAIEIVLTGLHNSDKLYQDDEIRKAVFDPSNANWIHHPKAMERVTHALAELELKADQKNHYIQSRINAENERKQRKVQNIDNAKQRLRNEVKHELEWLGTVDSSWIQKQEQRKQNIHPAFLRWVDVDKYSDLIGYSTDSDWIFECKREYWQSLIIEQLYRIGVNRGVKALHIKRFVQKYVPVNQNMQRLNTVQYQARQKAKANGSQTNKRIAWYLTKEENRKIISPFKVVLDYLQYLKIRGVLDITSDSSIFVLNDQSFEDFRRRIQNRNEEIAKYREECLRKEGEEKLRAERRQRITAEKKQHRVKRLIEADRIVFSHYGGDGLRCSNCQFTSPKLIVIESICPECNQKADFVDLFITQDYIDTAIHRYQCSAILQKSLECYP
ncbi:competence protein CoiA family protein [Vibrio rotiferianus]|uniref:competence protein CoiA family protein n=2 Tax=Vibrio rotiferianus TaxID=190895 RepID=UPI0039094684